MKTRTFRFILLFFLCIPWYGSLHAQILVLEDSVQPKQINGLAFNPISGELILSGTDNSLSRFNMATRQLEGIKQNFRVNSARRIAVSQKGQICVQNENAIDFLTLTPNGLLFGKSGKTRKECLTFDFFPDSDKLMYSDGSKLAVCDLQNGAYREVFQQADGKIIKLLRLFHHRPVAIILYEDQSLDLLNYELNVVVRSIPGSFGLVQSLDINPDDAYLVLGDQAGKVYVWDLIQNEQVFSYAFHSHAITSLLFAPHGNFVYSRSLDNTIRMFRVPDGKEFFRLETMRPNYPQLSLSKGGSLLAFNNGNRHIRIYNLQPLLADSLLAEARLKMNAKAYTEALQILSSALFYNTDGRIYEVRSRVFQQLGQTDSALSDLSRAIEQKHNRISNLLSRSGLYFGKDRLDEALNDADAVLNEVPSDTLALAIKIRVLFKKGDIKPIPALAEKLLNLITDKKPVLDLCIQSLIKLQDYKNALPWIDQRLRISQEPEQYYLRGKCYYYTGQYGKAAQDFLQHTKTLAGSPELTKFRALAAFTDGNYEMAESYFREYLLLFPRDPDCLNGQALCLMASDKQDELSALLKDRLPDTLNTHNRLFILAVNAALKRAGEDVPDMLRPVYTQNPAYTFSLGKDLRLNPLQPDQRLYSGILQCLSSGLQSRKPDFPVKYINETQADYNVRWQRAKQAIQAIVEECKASYQQTILRIIAESKQTISQPIGKAIESWDKAGGRLYLNFENNRFYIDKIDEVKYKAIENEGQAVILTGYKQYASDLVSWAYTDIQLVVPYFKEPLKAIGINPGKPAKAIPEQTAPVEDLAASTQARGTRPLTQNPASSAAPAAKPYKNYLLLIAVDDYKHWNKLQTPVNDINAFKEALLTRYYAFDSSTVFQLTNSEVTRSNIMKVLNKLSELITEDDRLIIYYAGHGAFNKFTNDGYWVPYDAEKEDWGDFFSYNDLKSYLRSFKSIHTLLINDACYSGLIASTRSPGISNIDKKENRPSCTVFVSGLGDEEVSDQFLQTGHSPFAYWIITKLKENQQSALSFLDLAYFVSNKVSAESGKPQNPIFKTVERSRDNDGQFFFHLKK